MKATTISIAFALFLGFSFSLSAQTTAIWQGGKPGRTTDWNCPANWNEGRVPDEFTQVIIPAGAHNYPVVQGAPTAIDALLMEAGTRLTIQPGATFFVLCETGRFEGITALGEIENNGTFKVSKVLHTNVAFLQQVHGNGIVISPTAGMDTLAKWR